MHADLKRRYTQIMKTTVLTFVSLVLLVFLTTCNYDKKDEYMAKGVLTGYDYRMCECCGGWLINLNSDSTEMYTFDTRFIDKYPANLKLDSTTVFPVFIRLDYTDSPANCGKAIDITRFEHR
jgi:hypothetical protein